MVNLSHGLKKIIRTDIAEWVKRRDYFGVPIGLTRNFYGVHRTVVSGALSMFLRVYMIYFAASTYIKV